VRLCPQESDQRYLTIAEEHLFASVEEPSEIAPAVRETMPIWSANSTQEKLSILFKRILLSRQVMAMKYHVPPNSLRIFWYYPVRLKELLQQNGRLGWQQLRKGAQLQSRLAGQDKAGALRSWLFSG
jgi:uncharacterized protein YpbB